jgi:hypothetical protein
MGRENLFVQDHSLRMIKGFRSAIRTDAKGQVPWGKHGS